jgi:hypothetical protein
MIKPWMMKPPPGNVETLLVDQSTVGTIGVFIGTYSSYNYRQAQTFTLDNAKTITAVSLYFGANYGSPTGQVTYRIETVSSSVPTGTLVDAGATIAFTPTENAWNKLTFAVPFGLASGTYGIRTACSVQGADTFWRLGYTSTSVYAGGCRCYSQSYSAPPTAMSTVATQDLPFRVYGY